jgi:hypothetical protein
VATSTASLHRTEVDGVSCVWSESKGDDLVAGLIFRVGIADESMRINGVSHLVEHLALPSGPVSGVEHNGTVDMLTTLFWAGGRAVPALDLIAQVAASLADPPLAQLPLERSIVKAEAAQRPWTNWHNALALRFGPVAHGLGMYEEYGVTAATDERVAGWAATRFTKGNASSISPARPRTISCSHSRREDAGRRQRRDRFHTSTTRLPIHSGRRDAWS